MKISNYFRIIDIGTSVAVKLIIDLIVRIPVNFLSFMTKINLYTDRIWFVHLPFWQNESNAVFKHSVTD
jgi:hypothetical protein